MVVYHIIECTFKNKGDYITYSITIFYNYVQHQVLIWKFGVQEIHVAFHNYKKFQG